MVLGSRRFWHQEQCRLWYTNILLALSYQISDTSSTREVRSWSSEQVKQRVMRTVSSHFSSTSSNLFASETKSSDSNALINPHLAMYLASGNLVSFCLPLA
jgi:hypothetical protein